jgi:hypothetical protein
MYLRPHGRVGMAVPSLVAGCVRVIARGRPTRPWLQAHTSRRQPGRSRRRVVRAPESRLGSISRNILVCSHNSLTALDLGTPAGVANFSRKPSRAWRRSQSPAAAKRDAMSCSQAPSQLPRSATIGHRVSAADLCCGAHRTPCYQSRIGKTSRKRSDIGKKTGPIGHRGD